MGPAELVLGDRPERWRDLWAEEDATLRASEEALASGTVTISEVPDVDLAATHFVGIAGVGPDAAIYMPGEADVAWYYPVPHETMAKIADHVAFYPSKTELSVES